MMTTADTLSPENLSVGSATDILAADLMDRRRFMEAAHDLDELGLHPARVAFLHSEGPSLILGVDLSDQPGGSFKYASALGAGLSLEEGIDTAVTASAGGYARALGKVGLALGLQVLAYTPRDLNSVKREGMKEDNVGVVAEFDDVAESLPAAELAAGRHDDWAFFHPFDNADGIALLTHLTDQVVDVVTGLEAGGVNLSEYDVKFLVQRGGGSLTSALAISVRNGKDEGRLADSASVVEVRPQLVNGELDPLYDGLKVEDPGTIAGQFLDDCRYVHERHEVSQAAVADGARRVFMVPGLSDVPYEANALAGVGAAEEMLRTSAKPTLYVTILSGRNAPQVQRDYLLGRPGLEEEFYAADASPSSQSSVANPLMSGYTAASREYSSYSKARSANAGSVPEGYYRHMQDSGVELLAMAGVSLSHEDE